MASLAAVSAVTDRGLQAAGLLTFRKTITKTR